MNVFTKGTFNRDVASLSDVVLLETLQEKIKELITAPNISHVTGVKLLKGYQTHYRIKVITERSSFRIGAVIRGNTVWLVRFLPRRKIYLHFP
ncbi:MAG: hypothetical protein KIT62_07270 [Cyclobacteriaceae bacterium]|nr:hypothetical protein [Cyclobacteriaceae bacterium]